MKQALCHSIAPSTGNCTPVTKSEAAEAKKMATPNLFPILAESIVLVQVGLRSSSVPFFVFQFLRPYGSIYLSAYTNYNAR